MSLANAQVPPLSATESARRTAAWSLIVAALLAVFYLVTSIVIASHRLLWYDEIFAVTISRLPSLAAIWQAMAHASDLLPPTYYMLIRLFEAPFGPAEVGARLPSALAMVAGMLIVFDCTRRLSDGLHGLIAFAILTCSSLPYYGYEARSYALFFMFAALALWIWIHGGDSKRSAVLFGVVIFLAVAVHYYAVLCLVPYAAWEVWAGKMRPLPSAKLIAGCIGVLCAAALFFQQIQALRGLVGDFWATPTTLALAALFSDFFPYGGLLLMLIVLWVALAGNNEGNTVVEAMAPPERLSWLFILIPLTGFVLAKLVTHAFFSRYFMGLLPGIAVASACLLWRNFSSAPKVSLGIAILLLLFGVNQQVGVLQHPERIDPWGGQQTKTRAMMRLEDSTALGQASYIVVPVNGLLGVEGYYYTKHPERYVFLIDPHVNSTGSVLVNLGKESGMRFWTVDELAAHAHEALLIEPSRETLNGLQEAGLRPKGRFAEGLEIVSFE